jgi:hypothetical protein
MRALAARTPREDMADDVGMASIGSSTSSGERAQLDVPAKVST